MLKFKYLIIVFCIIIIITVLITILLPKLLAGPLISVNLFNIILPLVIIMVLLLIGVFIFFLSNYRLLSLLEREDWPALSYYLEQKVLVKGRYSNRKVQLLASSYMVVSDYASVLKLENKAIHAKPAVVSKNALIFGIARILSGDQKGAAAFFKTYMDRGNPKKINGFAGITAFPSYCAVLLVRQSRNLSLWLFLRMTRL